LAGIQIPLLLCPSDSGNPILNTGDPRYQPDAAGKMPAAKTSYEFVANWYGFQYFNWWKSAGGNPPTLDPNNLPMKRRYAFGENSNTRIPDIADGTSNTFAMGEVTFSTYNGNSPPWAYRGWASVGIDPMGINNATVPQFGLNIWQYANATPVRGT